LDADAPRPTGGPAPEPAAAPPTPTPAAPEPEPATVRHSLRTLFKALAAVVGVATSVTALIFTFAPDLKPSGAAPTQAAKLSELSVDEAATFGQYLARIDQPRAGYTEADLHRRGALLDFRVRIDGFKNRRLLLKWELFDKESGDEIDQSTAIQIEPTNQTNEATWQFWVPIPRDGGPYVAIVELIEQKQNHLLKLATIRTKDLPAISG
jgi:hypothetical protein